MPFIRAHLMALSSTYCLERRERSIAASLNELPTDLLDGSSRDTYSIDSPAEPLVYPHVICSASAPTLDQGHSVGFLAFNISARA